MARLQDWMVVSCIMYLIPISLRDAGLFSLGANGSQHLFQFILLKEVWYFTRVQHVINILQELFHHNLKQMRKTNHMVKQHHSTNTGACYKYHGNTTTG